MVIAVPTITIRSIWAAAWLASRGLTFVRAVPAGPASRIVFVFEDADHVARDLVRDFYRDRGVQRLIDARRAMTEIVEIAQRYGVAEAADVESLALLDMQTNPTKETTS